MTKIDESVAPQSWLDTRISRRRLLAYRDQTAPLVTYYKLQSVLRPIDGMADVAEVASAIDALLEGTTGKTGTHGIDETLTNRSAENAERTTVCGSSWPSSHAAISRAATDAARAAG